MHVLLHVTHVTCLCQDTFTASLNRNVLLQSMNDENATCRRVLKYVVPVLSFSILFNVPKFFEAEIGYDEESGR